MKALAMILVMMMGLSAQAKNICVESDGTYLTVAEVEDAVAAYIEDIPEATDYSTEYDLLVDELCVGGL